MPKADVTYNTIGFVGTVGTGATFTLYLDNEKTGAKTYHVYFKQLGGTGKLTLTTGKAGATNLTLNAGTYVAIIYVDENGNVTNTASTPTATIEVGSTQPATSGGVSSAISTEVSDRNTAIQNAIQALDVTSVGGSGKYIEAISETDGKISATVQNIANEVTANNMQSVSSNAVAQYCVSKIQSFKTGTVSSDYTTVTFSGIDTGSMLSCKVLIIGNGNRVYLGLFSIANFSGVRSVAVSYAPNMTITFNSSGITIVMNNDNVYSGFITTFDPFEDITTP